MTFKLFLLAGVAAAAMSGVARADDTYRCGDTICYDDQADETRRLNEMQLENPGAGANAVPDADDSYDDEGEPDDSADGQGGPYYPVDPSDDTDPPDTADSPDDSAYPDDDSYPDDGDAPDDADDGDDDDMPYPNDDD